ncbi:MAG: hypothetical protein IJ608_13735 [Lachnospiraceae bacterium]|nr:hypothetical protein [Lachnospiraceae bacterium]
MDEPDSCFIPVAILARIAGRTENKIRKTYRKVIRDGCIPLAEVPLLFRELYASEYLFRGRMIDFPFIDAVNTSQLPAGRKPFHVCLFEAPEVKELLSEMEMLRMGVRLSDAHASDGLATKALTELAGSYGYSYSTYMRRRKIYMNNTSLSLALMHASGKEDTRDRYRTACFYCRDLIIFLHEKPGKISSAKIFRDINKAVPVKCSECPYHPDVKEGDHKKGDFIPEATCHRNSEHWITPNCEDTVCTIVSRIPEQQDVLAWEGVRSWASKFHYTPSRKKPDVVNYVWFSDHKRLDIVVRIRRRPDGTWETGRPWLTAILDCASNVLVSYVLSLNPNSDCIAECFARACAFTVDTPYAGIPDYFYIDNGKDYRSKKMKGLPNSEESHLYLNRDFGESGILEWFGIKVIHALPYRGCSKTIESVWRAIDIEWFKPLPGYCGENPESRPFTLEADIDSGSLYTFQQFADHFADTIYPGYNNHVMGRESPNDLYRRLPKTSSYVPTWRTLSVLKSVTALRDIDQKGIQYLGNRYWCSELGPLVGTKDVRIFAFDTPFNRNISVVKDHRYIGEAHMIEHLNVVEHGRHKVVEHIAEQARQYKHYSKKIKDLHNIVLQTDISERVTDVPAIDNIRYGQTVDVSRDGTEAHKDESIPAELKEQAARYAENLLNPDAPKTQPGEMTRTFSTLGKEARKRIG